MAGQENDTENCLTDGSCPRRRSRSDSNASARSRDDSGSKKSETKNFENRELAKKPDANISSKRRAGQRHSSTVSSTESLNKKEKFGSNEIFKLILGIKTIDSKKLFSISKTANRFYLFQSFLTLTSLYLLAHSIDYKRKLADFVKAHDISAPKYTTTTHKNGDLVVYYAKLQIGHRNFVTFPDCYHSEESAEHAVAKKTLEELTSLLDLSSSSESLSAAEGDQIKSIAKLFNERDDLFLSDHLEKRYYEVYHQNLLANWLDLIKSSNWFSVDETRVGEKSFFSISLTKLAAESIQPAAQQPARIVHVEAGELSIVKERNETEENEWNLRGDQGDEACVENKEPVKREAKEELGFVPAEETRCTNLDEVAVTYHIQTNFDPVLGERKHDKLNDFHTLHTILELPSDLELPINCNWIVHALGKLFILISLIIQMTHLITCLMTNLYCSLSLDTTETGEIVLRLANGYPDLLRLTDEMNRFYLQERKGKQKKLVKGNVYAAVFGKTVFRVQMLRLLPEDRVQCKCLDDGAVEVVSHCNLFEIERQFLRLPWQSFQARFDGVEPLLAAKCSALVRLFIELRILEHEKNLYLIAKPTCLEPIIVRLYDTSHPDRDLDLNKLLMNFLSQC